MSQAESIKHMNTIPTVEHSCGGIMPGACDTVCSTGTLHKG